MENAYESYTLMEIKHIINGAVEIEMLHALHTDDEEVKIETLKLLQTRLYDLFGMEE